VFRAKQKLTRRLIPALRDEGSLFVFKYQRFSFSAGLFSKRLSEARAVGLTSFTASFLWENPQPPLDRGRARPRGRRRYALARPGVVWPRRRPCEVGTRTIPKFRDLGLIDDYGTGVDGSATSGNAVSPLKGCASPLNARARLSNSSSARISV